MHIFKVVFVQFFKNSDFGLRLSFWTIFVFLDLCALCAVFREKTKHYSWSRQRRVRVVQKLPSYLPRKTDLQMLYQDFRVTQLEDFCLSIILINSNLVFYYVDSAKFLWRNRFFIYWGRSNEQNYFFICQKWGLSNFAAETKWAL